MIPPTSGWPLRAYEALRKRDKPGFELALLRYSMGHSKEQAHLLALGLFDLLQVEERNWWMAADMTLPDIDLAGQELFAKLLAQIAAQINARPNTDNT